MRLPSKRIGEFAHDLISQCLTSRDDRLQRGAMYRNLYLTGDDNADPATYNKTYPYIDNLSSYLYSPVELRFNIEHYGYSNAVDRAMMNAGTAELHKQIRRSNLEIKMEDAVTWALVKGKSFIKNLWTVDGFQPYLIQPEMMGVLREDLGSLDEQEAFTHTVYLSPERFLEMIKYHPKRNELMKKVKKYINPGKGDDSPEKTNNLKQVILGGLQPYQVAGGGSRNSSQRGVVNWLTGPYPDLAPELLQKLIRLDELWVWDDDRDDWTTIQMVGQDCVIEGEDFHRNIFADQFDPDNKEISTKTVKDNPLSGEHPFREICPNQIDGYFWGRSEICNIALLQKSINMRVNGINSILRLQEKPPRFFKGGQGVTASQYSKLSKPGGYLSDSNPNATIQTLAPELPQGLWESLHEFEKMFDEMAGFTPALQGKGEAGVRAGGHAETLVRTASPRFKDRALIVERQIEAIGSLALDMLKAHLPYKIEAWTEKKKAGIFASLMPSNWLEEPPVKGMVPIEFLIHDLPEDCKVVVDSHSSSPAFSHETRALLFDLFKAGAVKPETLVMHTHPPGQDTIIEDLKMAEAEKAELIAQHPELLEQHSKGKKKK